MLTIIQKTLIFTLAFASSVASFAAFANDNAIILQSTTSTQSSGLFDYILPRFTARTGIIVNVVAVGTGQALKNGRNGDGDILLVHAKSAEEKFVADGYGVARFDVMYNDFIVVGPLNDPAKISGEKNILTALKKLSASNSIFASRGDDSGTNRKELQLWQEAGIDILDPSGSWYRETGSGMGATLNIAAGMGAYTLTDRATWISFKNKSGLKILSENDPRLFNQYGIILVNPDKYKHVNATSGRKFITWITGQEGQAAIANYRHSGKQLFFPNAKFNSD